MIRFINCMRKRDDVSVNDFRKYWQDEKFDDFIRSVVKVTKAERYAKNLTLSVEANIRVMADRGGDEPYDGILEYWWTNARELMDVYETPEATDLRKEIMEYQRQFVDFDKSTAFFTEYENE